MTRDDLLARSNERDQYERRILAAWTDGYAAAEQAHAEDYDQGLCDGALARKRAEHDLVQAAALDVARWGPAGREHYGDARPGDYEPGSAYQPPPGAWLGGPAVHWHKCIPACHAYQPGFYPPAEAVAILSTLPACHDYTEAIARLGGAR